MYMYASSMYDYVYSNYCCAFELMFSFLSTFKFLYTMIKQNILHKIKLTHDIIIIIITAN